MSYERWCGREQQAPSPEAQERDFVLRGTLKPKQDGDDPNYVLRDLSGH